MDALVCPNITSYYLQNLHYWHSEPLYCLEDPTLYWTLICFLCVCDRGTVLQNASLLIFVSSCSFHAPDGISRIVAVHSQVDANEISKLAAKAREKQEIGMAA